MIEVIALLVGVITTFLIGLTVYSKNKNNLTNKIFIGLVICIIGWAITTYFSLHTTSGTQTLHWIRLIMFFVVLQNTFFFFLVRIFPDHQIRQFRKKRYLIAIIYSVLTAIVALSPYLFVSFKNGSPQPGPGMVLFLPHALIFALGGVISLFIRHHRAYGFRKVQLQYVLFGTLLMFTLEPVSDFVIPVAFKNHSLVKFSPLYIIIFSSVIAYAIIAKKLFDIKAVVVRSVAYALIIITISIIYGAILLGFINVIFAGPSRILLRQILSVILIVPIALSFHNIKLFFDKLTNRVFYRDYYEIQSVLDLLGDVVVDEIDLQKIIQQTKNILHKTLKPSFIEFVLIKDGKPYLEPHNRWKSNINADNFLNDTQEQHKTILVVDELSGTNELKDDYQKHDISLSLRLKTHNQVVGFILFGIKNSGEIYNSKDRKLLILIANELAITIQNALRFEEIQKFNLTLQFKIEEATHKLSSANAKLRELDETKDEFISMASHQLRTPLTSIKGYISMVLEGDAGKISQMQRKLLDQAFVSSERMVFLISDLLNISRLRTGKFVIDAKPTNLAQVIEGEIHQLTEMGKSKNIAISFNKPDDFPDLMLDENKIRQVVMNFADNAIYYTPVGGRIKLDLNETDDRITFTVTDTGIGVPKSEQHHLFSKFFRAGNARKARPDGTGLGLFMAKKVIDVQGGEIIFHSEEGKGSTFGFSFSKHKLRVKPVSPQEIAQAATSK